MTDYINPSLIHIESDRQRQDLGDLSELQASIAAIGLINPIVIDEANRLIAGERRLTACLALGMDSIPYRRFEDLSELQKQVVELEENVKRKDLTWQEHVAAVQRYHQLHIESGGEASWSEADTAEALGVSAATVNRHLFVARHMDKPEIASAQALSVALNAAKRREERQTVGAKHNLDEKIDSMFTATAATVDLAVDENAPATPAPKPVRSPILNVDFTKWKPSSPVKFNFIHCDFPYGIGTGDKIGQSAAKHSGTYDDSFETYANLITYFLDSFTPRYVADSAHLMFWFSMKYYGYTLDRLTDGGWSVNPVPLVWAKSDNRGVLPDPNRSPRQITEFALLASRGDRKIVQAKANAYWGPTTRAVHTSEKPLSMLDHFFQMLVDENTVFLDPTCGSGNSVITAHKRGARSLGLELDREFAIAASYNFEKETKV